ncbi:unnamed protein product [Rotaria sp. Silwood1]|nr:unnamed protein product [Rotaria sp. Silwood1]CAF0900094.1 unnamed protein product [Rotaria sp. Silwood1]CAF3370835.1 unnamed protein product [Rotaria sp. Silwood1]CAF3372530.1 unnamed protein product [Rotaria sp. Silwood1]CAF4516306.1 unnamed protein product [Rotaria sp. Silwood1]
MSMIYFAIGTLFLASRILASLPPAVVYSAAIYNAQDSPIQCNVIWSQPSGPTLESGLFPIEQHESYSVKEKIIKMETWEANAIIEEIHCGKLVLKAAFDKVTSPQKNWLFRVEQDAIVSVGPSS